METPDPLYAERLAREVLRGTNPGLPSHMWRDCLGCAHKVLEGDDLQYQWLIMLLVQARNATMTKEEVVARQELERLSMTILFGTYHEDRGYDA